MPTLLLDRRQREITVLAVISLIAVGCTRLPVESSVCFGFEMLALAACYVIAASLNPKSNSRAHLVSLTCLIAIPVLASLICRFLDEAIAIEMTALTLLGTAALGMSVSNRRLQSVSVICSGFLTFFATVISDSPFSVILAIVWITGCIWHLVANHWERIELCSMTNLQRQNGLRPATVLIAVGLFLVGGMIAKGRMGDSQRFSGGFMPTSGGSSWSDPGALRGVGSGEAAIAGVEKADSFGAVDSELFLESTESTLFDMFSDSIGQPKRKGVWERRQGMSSEEVLEAHGKTSKSEKGTSTFSTDRLPPERHSHLEDSESPAVVQWSGRSGIRLAMNRYDTFDGVDWTNNASHQNQALVRRPLGEQIWFFDPATMNQILGSGQSEAQHELLKVIRLDSTRLPVPMMSSGVHIKDIDRQDFYAIDDDGSFCMPGRVKVPPMTVVHVASLMVLEDELLSNLNDDGIPCQSAPAEIKRLTQSWTSGHRSKYQQLDAVVSKLRDEFEFDRSVDFGSENQLEAFLDQRRGGDHLFATTAALMAREIGLKARLVTGFYVRPAAFEMAAGHSNVLSSDVHVWVEIAMEDGRWFEIEPTPGFRPPYYKPSLLLTTKRFAAAHWPHAVALVFMIVFVVVTRLIWTEWLVAIIWRLSAPLGARRRMELAMQIFEFRVRMLRHSRPETLPARQWLLENLFTHVDKELFQRAESFCDVADQLCFGRPEQRNLLRDDLRIIDTFVRGLPLRILRKHLMEKAI